jgi:predicted permease
MNAMLVVLPIFLLIGMGWALKEKGLLSDQTLKENNFILYWFAMPATLLEGILGADITAFQDAAFFAAVWSPYLVTTLLVWLTARSGEPTDRFAVLTLSASRGNHFFAGIPVVRLAMGNSGAEAGTFILTFSLVVMQFLSIGSGQLAMSGSLSWKSLRETAAQLLKNPPFLACLAGLLLLLMGINQSRLPGWMNATLALLADISTGLALIALGAGLRLKNVMGMLRSVWKIVFFKLAVHPLVSWGIFLAFGLPREMLQAGVLLAAMPVAVNTGIFAQATGMDGEYSAQGIAVTTLVSMLSLPLWIRILGIAV